jgi:tannase
MTAYTLDEDRAIPRRVYKSENPQSLVKLLLIALIALPIFCGLLAVMYSSLWAPVVALVYASVAGATSLSEICTESYAQAALPVDVIDGITVDTSSVTTSLVTNYTASSIFYPTDTFDYCNLTFAYSHNGIDGDVVHVQYWLPDPANFKNRYVSTGGGGWAINSGSTSIPTGIIAGG